MQKKLVVNMAQLSVVKAPDAIETQALGSCVGIVIFDELAGIAGMLHAMLPSIERSRNTSKLQRAKFVDSAIELLIEEMTADGAERRRMKAKLAGGANMFPSIVRKDAVHIGLQNVEMAKTKLAEFKIPLIAEDTGGSSGRTISMDTTTWKLHIRSAMSKERWI